MQLTWSSRISAKGRSRFAPHTCPGGDLQAPRSRGHGAAPPSSLSGGLRKGLPAARQQPGGLVGRASQKPRPQGRARPQDLPTKSPGSAKQSGVRGEDNSLPPRGAEGKKAPWGRGGVGAGGAETRLACTPAPSRTAQRTRPRSIPASAPLPARALAGTHPEAAAAAQGRVGPSRLPASVAAAAAASFLPAALGGRRFRVSARGAPLRSSRRPAASTRTRPEHRPSNFAALAPPAPSPPSRAPPPAGPPNPSRPARPRPGSARRRPCPSRSRRFPSLTPLPFASALPPGHFSISSHGRPQLLLFVSPLPSRPVNLCGPSSGPPCILFLRPSSSC